MRWNAISGSWRKTSPEVGHDVRLAVAQVMNRGDGIVTGGALGVDYIATDEALIHNPDAKRIKIFLPTTLEIYATHYRKRAVEGVITKEQAEALIGLLTNVKTSNKESVIEMEYTVLNEETYYDRNTRVVENADRLFAFQVNGSGGVQDTIDKARKFGLEVVLKQYTIDN
ncbi:MAG: hypothetical protein WBB39_00890 [Candidatus Saccharimonadales bacterium]